MNSSSGKKQLKTASRSVSPVRKTAHRSRDQTPKAQTAGNKGSKVGSASRSVKAPRNSTEISEERPDENDKDLFAVLSYHLRCFPELDAEMMKLPVNRDSALNRLAGKLKPGDVPSSVPVRKRLTHGKSKASGKGSLESKKKSLCIIPMKFDQADTEHLPDQKSDHMHPMSSLPPTTSLPEISIENEQEVLQTDPAEAGQKHTGSYELTPPSFLPADQPASGNALPVCIQTVLPLRILLVESGHDTNQPESALAFNSCQPQEPTPRQVLEPAFQPLYMVIKPTSPVVCASMPAQRLPIVPLDQRVMFFPGGMPTQAIGPQELSVELIQSQMISSQEQSTEMYCAQGRSSQITSPQGKVTQMTGTSTAGTAGTSTKMTGVEETLPQKVGTEETSIQILSEETTKQITGAARTMKQAAGSEWATTEMSGAEETSTQLTDAEGTFLEIIGTQQAMPHLTSSQIVDFLADSLEMAMPQVTSSQLMSLADNTQEAVSPTFVQEEGAQVSVTVETDYYKCGQYRE